MTLKYKVGDVVVLAENVDQNLWETFVPGVAVKIDQLCNLDSDEEYYVISLVSDPSDYWYIMDNEINHEATEELQKSNETGDIVGKEQAVSDDNAKEVRTPALEGSDENEWFKRGKLPPVGTKCIFFSDDFENEDYWNQDLTNECEVEILAHFKSDKSSPENDIAAFVFEYKGGSYQVEQAIAACFRPWCSDEEIAKQERSAYCDRIYSVLCKVNSYNQRDMAKSLYDAGLRFVGEGK